MDWKDISGVIGKAAPILGTLVGGPGGAAIGALISSALGSQNTPEDVRRAVMINPDAALKLAEIESSQKVRLQELLVDHAKAEYAAISQGISDVNKTMQVEARDAQHWMSYTWRPFIGFITGSMIFCIYFLLPLLKIPVPTIPETVWVMQATILGTASFFQGRALADPSNTAVTRG